MKNHEGVVIAHAVPNIMQKIIENEFLGEFDDYFEKLERLFSEGVIDKDFFNDAHKQKEYQIQLRLDDKTGLCSSASWRSLLECMLKEKYDIASLEKATPQEASVILRRMALDNCVCIWMGDMSYLSLANGDSGEHVEGGDALIKGIGKAFQELALVEYIRPGHSSGDEFEVFSVGVSQECIRLLVEKFLQEIRGIRIPNLQEYDLVPHMDFGFVKLSETCSLLADILERGLSTGKPSRLDFLIDVSRKMADMRSAIAKGLTRIPLLIRLQEEMEPVSFGHVASFLRKGAFGIDDTKISHFGSLQTTAHSEYEEEVLDFIVSRLNRRKSQSDSDQLIIDTALEPWGKKI